MLIKSNAKINLGLSIIEKRLDGFHNIESLFIPIPWCDEIELNQADSTTLQVEGIEINGSLDENLCLRAYHILQKKFGIPTVRINLKKQIPIGAGLGGGSSNAAFVLKGLNSLFDLNLSDDSLETIADELGSDCSFFIKNKIAYVSGKGEILDTEVDFSINTYCIVVNPNIHISTKEAYSNVTPSLPDINIRDAIKQPSYHWQGSIINDFEEGLIKKNSTLKALKENLLEMGAYYVSMSGSGSSFFAFFNDEPKTILFNSSYQFKSFKLNV